jgi:hypothetical protein
MEGKLDTLIQLTKQSLVVQLYQAGAPMQEISKNLHITTATVVAMLKGIKKLK